MTRRIKLCVCVCVCGGCVLGLSEENGEAAIRKSELDGVAETPREFGWSPTGTAPEQRVERE